MRILVVEDETMLRSTIVRGLAKIDAATVNDAGDLEAVLDILDQTPPDVIVSDIDLPGRSGLELLGELGRRGLRIPVIFVSGYLQAYRSQIPPHANVEVMEKPVSLDELRTAVLRRSPRASRPTVEAAPFSVADYLQLAGIGRHSVVLEVERDGRVIGEVVVWAGETWSAADDLGGGEAALRRLAFSTMTQVRCRTLLEHPEVRNLSGHWEMVLLEAARQNDEERASTADLTLDEAWDGEPPSPKPSPSSPRPPGPPPASPSPPQPRRSALEIAFEEAWEEGLEALLTKDYPAALRAFLAARELKPEDLKVHANLKRLSELGYGADSTGPNSQ